MAKLYFYYAAMNAGKSTMLLQSAYNYRERGMQVLLLTSSLDDRNGSGVIRSRVGCEDTAHIFSHSDNLLAIVREQPKLECILIDEAQFMTKDQVLQCCQIVDELQIPVLAFGLRTDFQGEPFVGSSYLLGLADLLQEVKAVCHCGKKATMNMRVDAKGQKISSGAQVLIGGNERYVAVCRKHYNLGESGLANSTLKHSHS